MGLSSSREIYGPSLPLIDAYKDPPKPLKKNELRSVLEEAKAIYPLNAVHIRADDFVSNPSFYLLEMMIKRGTDLADESDELRIFLVQKVPDFIYRIGSYNALREVARWKWSSGSDYAEIAARFERSITSTSFQNLFIGAIEGIRFSKSAVETSRAESDLRSALDVFTLAQSGKEFV